MTNHTRFSIIVVDPPWAFSSNSKAKPGRNARKHYPCMSDAELRDLSIPAKKDALMFMWTTAPMLDRAMPIMRAWGFKYVSQLIWVKSRIATGFWARNRHELCLIGRRGAGVPRPAKLDETGKPCLDKNGRIIRIAPFRDSVIVAPTREHSRKPDELQEMIDAVWPKHSKIEMFARHHRPGWTAWGNETCKFDEVAV